MTKRLTQRALDALVPTPGRQPFVWDTEVTGFGVRVSPGGTKTYVVKYRVPATRQSRRKPLGRVGVVSLARARVLARVALGQVAEGKDPMREADEAKRALTVSAAAAQFMVEHGEARRKPSTQRMYRLAIERHLRPTLGGVPISALGPDDVRRLHQRLKAAPYLANRVIAVTSKLVAWSVQAGMRPAGPNPCQGIEKYPEQARRRYLSTSELKRLGAALRVAERRRALSPSSIAIVRLLLLTGARVSEIAALEWAHVDLAGAMLNLPDSKTGRKTILLSRDAIAVLRAWPRYSDSPFVFPGERHRPVAARAVVRLLHLTGARPEEISSLEWPQVDLTSAVLRLPGGGTVALSPEAVTMLSAWPRRPGSPRVFEDDVLASNGGRHRVALADAWSWLRKRARLGDARMHDLRHSFASVAVSAHGHTLPVIGALLGHSQPATTARYAHLQADPLRAANEQTAGTIAAAISRART